jgi:nucleotide-binding universal stress UspA family protein
MERRDTQRTLDPPNMEGSMFNHVMIGVDEHQGGRDAIALARQLVADDGELTLAHVHTGYPGFFRADRGEFERIERDRALSVLATAAKETDIDARELAIASPSVGRGLHELAEREGADLLVVGSNRRGLLGRVTIGDDTSHALNGAPCAVAIAPAGYARDPHKLTEIGVAYDASAESRHAIKFARALADERGSKLSAFQAVTVPSYVFAAVPVPTKEALDEYIEDARETLNAFHGVEAHVAYGDPVEELTLYSASVDLLVAGSRDYGPVGRIVHGSTSHRLARTARSPLLVLTRAARAADEGDREGTVAATTAA